MIINEFAGSLSEKSVNTALVSFVPQTHHSIIVAMRYIVGSRSTRSAWRSFSSTKIRGDIVHTSKISMHGRGSETIYMMHSSNTLINAFPPFVGYGKRIAIVIDYRLLLEPRRYYAFYIKATESISKDLVNNANSLVSIENHAVQIHGKDPMYGLLGYGPLGLYVSKDFEDKVRKQALNSRLIHEDARELRLVESIEILYQNRENGVDMLLYIYFPSELEHEVFSYVVPKTRDLVDVEEVVLERKDNAIEKLAREFDVVIIFTTDPLPLLAPLRKYISRWRYHRVYESEHREELLNRLFIVHYIALYLNLAKHYYDKLYKIVKKLGDAHNEGRRYIEFEEYRRSIARIPLLAINMPGKIDRGIAPRSFDKILPIGMYSKGSRIAFRVLSPDVVVTRYDELVNFSRRILSSIVTRLDIDMKLITANGNRLDNEEIGHVLGTELDMRTIIAREIISLARKYIEGREHGIRFASNKVIHRDIVYYVDDLRRVSTEEHPETEGTE